MGDKMIGAAMDSNWWAKIAHFAPIEFDDPEVPGSHEYMYEGTITLIDRLRKLTGWPILTHNKHGLRGCVCIRHAGHSDNSLHHYDHPDGCSAVDWHFVTDASPRDQAMAVLRSGFTGIGIYYDWRWPSRDRDGRLVSATLPVGFHTDLRPRPQIWTRKGGEYIYWLA